MKNIFIFLLIPFLISALDEELKNAIYYLSKNGLLFLSTTGRYGQNLNKGFDEMVEDFLGPPSLASSVKAINNLRKEIISHLDELRLTKSSSEPSNSPFSTFTRHPSAIGEP